MNGSDGLLGPAKASARLQELQARIDAFSPQLSNAVSFGSALSGAIGAANPADVAGMKLTPDSSLLDAATTIANQNGVDPSIFKSLVQTESAWNPSSVSSKGAVGLTQLMPSTAKDLGVNDPYDAMQNLAGGAKYLRQMLDKFGGDYTKALAAYNAGPGAVEKANGIPPYQETIAYVRSILSRAQAGGKP
jgi:soluble lytic murein transglycosylase-like protein